MFLSNLYAIVTDTTIKQNTNLSSTIKPISVSEFVDKINLCGDMILEALSGMITPIVSISLLLSIIVYITGSIIQSDKTRRVGAGGIATVIFGFFLYIISPYIMGVLYEIALVFK